MVSPVKKERRRALVDGFYDMPLMDRLYYERSDIQSITHLDFSARIQTVHKETNPRYWELIHAFKQLTGYSVLVNTSFNVRGEPIVCTPYDAYACFMATDMDCLVVGDYLFDKAAQPDSANKARWKKDFKAD
jgi:carbamoyltransferase